VALWRAWIMSKVSMNSATSNPVVSVIVPARNEEACLAQCLESLVAQSGIDFEIIVVDDASVDRTAEIAELFAITLISAPALPENWTGKNNAMAAGAKIAEGKWLLFTDADTVHKTGSLARAVAEAESNRAALLSYSPEQEVRGMWEKAVMPAIFAELAATYPPNKVNDPASPIAAANGQYLLISREAYDAVGGHTSTASDLLEDVAMARLVKSSGRKIVFRYGNDAVRTRMYRSWSQMKEGWTKNLALLFRRPVALAVFRLTECLLLFGNLLAAFVAWSSGNTNVAVLTISLGLLIAVLSSVRIRRAHFSWTLTLLALAGLPVFSYLLFRSAALHRNHGVTWKGRKYGSLGDADLPKHSP
jgi:glycosyltransferase involved in cell wall biosynthesis